MISAFRDFGLSELGLFGGDLRQFGGELCQSDLGLGLGLFRAVVIRHRHSHVDTVTDTLTDTVSVTVSDCFRTCDCNI